MKAYAGDVNALWLPADDKVKYFHLANLWEQYDEWSAYGAGVPISMQSSGSVTQYYTPYLSAIQIYTTRSTASPSVLCSEDADRKSNSSSGEGFDNEGSSLTSEHMGHLYFEFSDSSSPYGRLPLTNKVSEFAESYPGLNMFRSCDLSPASWISIAWYPIYHIPSKINAQELSACFLTYHTLSAAFQDDICREESFAGYEKRSKIDQIPLKSFGLASYKMQKSFWINPEAGDHEKYMVLCGAADSWLKQIGFKHHDFNFFTSR